MLLVLSKVKFHRVGGLYTGTAPTVITSLAGGPVVSGSPTDTIILPSAEPLVTATGSFSTPGTGTVTLLTNIRAACSATWGTLPVPFTFGAGSNIVLP